MEQSQALMQIRLENDQYVIRDESRQHLQDLRKLPGRIWDGQHGVWRLPFVKEVYEALKQGTWMLPEGLAVPERSGYTIELPKFGLHLLIRTLGTPTDVDRCKRIPEFRAWSSKDKAWSCRASTTNINYLLKAFPQAQWLGGAAQLRDQALKEQIKPPDQWKSFPIENVDWAKPGADYTVAMVDDYRFRTAPYQHQLRDFIRSRNLTVFGIFWEQGTGKTWYGINQVAYLFLQKKIDGALIVCTNAMKDVWAEELQVHCPESIDLDVFVWEARTRHKAEAWILKQHKVVQPLRLLIMNFEAFSGEIGARIGELFVARHGSIVVLDESTKIKANASKRSKNLTKIGKGAYYRRIMTGQPVPKDPLDIYAQARFLDPNLLAYSNWWSFRNRYAIIGGFNNRQVVGYAHLDELKAKVDKFTSRVLKVDCLDLPEKIYEKLMVELNPEQQRLYTEMRNDMQAELGGKTISVTLAIQRIQALSRITGGFFPFVGEDDDGLPIRLLEKIPGPNPKVEALVDLIEDGEPDDKYIIWCKFTAEIELLGEVLAQKFGEDQVVLFYGKTTKIQRKEARLAFQNDPTRARFFVGQPQAGGMGLTLTRSHQVVYYSNDYNLEARLQSEDRAHRIGQTKNVVYTDLVAQGTIDARLLAALRSKKKLADLITGDPSLSWL